MTWSRCWMSASLVAILSGCEPGDDTGGPTSGEPPGGVFLNEALASPGSQQDWVEILSTLPEPVDLSGAHLRITAQADGSTMDFPVPPGTVLQPGAFWLAGAATLSKDGPVSACPTSFQLPNGALGLELTGANGEILDQLAIEQAPRDDVRPGLSFGRFPDGTGPVMVQGQPSPDEKNVGPATQDACLTPPDSGTFDGHSFPCVGAEDSFFWLAGSRAGTTTVKFVILSYREPEERHITFLDSVFYSIHDEWYYFHMLNGQPVEGEDVYSPYQGSFDSVDEIYSWAQGVDALPYDETFLDWSGDRLISRRFYDMALDIQPRLLGSGTLVYVPARDEPPAREAVWGFELEYRDEISHEDLSVYYEELKERLPAEIWDQLHWIVRSPAQEELAQTMEQAGLPYGDRILRYSELSVPGETQVYNEGLIAGRLRIVHAGEAGMESATTTDILVLEEIPDYLPPCRALITTIPQTPLSHIGLLAKSRGIPNLYIGDISNDPAWDQWGRVRAHLALYAEGPDKYKVVPLTDAEYDTWTDLLTDIPHALPPIDMASVPLTVDLSAVDPADIPSLRPVLGGKSAGLVALLGSDGVTTPDHPLAITVRAYDEHIQPLRAAWLDELMTLPEFTLLANRRARYLVLEGEAAYDAQFPTPSGALFKKAFLENHPPGDLMGDLLLKGGVREIVRSTPIAPATLAQIEAALASRFGDFSATQGLRFRSSSNVEDVDGFNGAGLYESHTGFSSPASAVDPDDMDRTVEGALRKTWASYWSWEAFDERLQANIEHLSGHMGVLVHARFDDDRELANGVFTLTRFPDDPPAHAPDQFADRYEMWINLQKGSLSVTNPLPGQCVLPEGVRVHLPRGSDTPVIERLQGSTEVAPGTEIESDAALLSLFEQGVLVTENWLEHEKSELPEEQRRRTLTLDFEIRRMAANWPSLAAGPPFPERMIVKQARTLEPSISNVPADVVALPFPRDVLGRARNIVRRTCDGAGLTLTVLEATTDPLEPPDLGHEVVPFTAEVTLDVAADIPELGWLSGTTVVIAHTSLSGVDHPGMLDGAAWTLSLQVDPAFAGTVGLSTLVWTPEEAVVAQAPSGEEVSIPVSGCVVETLHATPDNYLLTLLASAD